MAPKRGERAADLYMANFFRNISRWIGPGLRMLAPGMVERRSANLVTDISGIGMRANGAEPVRVHGSQMALTIATVYRCVKILSESVAALPLWHERRTGGIFRKCEDALSVFLTMQPNEWQTAFDFMKQLVQQVLLAGEAYVVPQYYMDGSLKRLVLASPHSGGPSTGIGYYEINDPDQGLSGEYREDEVIRIKGMSIDGRNCLSVLGYASTTMSLAATADNNTLTNFANGGAPLGILTNEGGVPGYGEIQQKALQAAAERVSQSLKNGDRLSAIGGTWKLIQYGMSASDMQFLESRKFTVREICRFFGVHPSFVFDDTSNNYKSAEMANVAFLSNTLNPIMRQIEDEFSRKLLGVTFGERFRFDRAELYATDLEGRMNFIEKRIQTGTMTPNEARAEMGMDPVEGGDSLLLSANLKTIGEIENGKEEE